MNKAHSPINWENYPKETTPINEENLNKMDRAIGVIDDRVVELDNTKASKDDVSTVISNVEYDEQGHALKFTLKNGDVKKISISNVIVDNVLSETSTNPVQNKVVTAEVRRLSEEIAELNGDLDTLNQGGLNLKEDFIGQQVNGWLDKHPEATTTVQDHSLTIDKMVVGTLSYVTPEMFGAVGDGVTDDTEAMKRCFSSRYSIIMNDSEKCYLIDNILTISSPKTIISNGATIKASKRLAESIVTTSYDGFITITNTKDVFIIGLKIDGSKKFYERTDDTSLESTTVYYDNRNKGQRGIMIYNSENIWISNCYIRNTITGIHQYRTENVVVEQCTVEYTSADAFPVYTGCHNITIRDCVAKSNCDDAFPVYSSTGDTGATQTTDVMFFNCIAENNYARAMLNHGGKNVTFKNINVIDCRIIFAVLGKNFSSEKYSVFETDNTVIEAVDGTVKMFNGFTTASLAQTYDCGNLDIRHCDFGVSRKSGDESLNFYFIAEYDGNIEMINSKFNYSSPYINGIASYKAKDCVFEELKNNPRFNANNIKLSNVRITNESSYGFTATECANLDCEKITIENGKAVSVKSGVTNIVTDNISMFNASIKDCNIIFKTIQYGDVLPRNTAKYKNSELFILNGVIHVWNGTEWVVSTQ